MILECLAAFLIYSDTFDECCGVKFDSFLCDERMREIESSRAHVDNYAWALSTTVVSAAMWKIRSLCTCRLRTIDNKRWLHRVRVLFFPRHFRVFHFVFHTKAVVGVSKEFETFLERKSISNWLRKGARKIHLTADSHSPNKKATEQRRTCNKANGQQIISGQKGTEKHQKHSLCAFYVYLQIHEITIYLFIFLFFHTSDTCVRSERASECSNQLQIWFDKWRHCTVYSSRFLQHFRIY